MRRTSTAGEDHTDPRRQFSRDDRDDTCQIVSSEITEMDMILTLENPAAETIEYEEQEREWLASVPSEEI